MLDRKNYCQKCLHTHYPFPQKIHARKTLSTLIQDVQETHIKMFLYDDAMHLLRIFHISITQLVD